MQVRIATTQDLPNLNKMFQDIIKDMYEHSLELWDEIYPCCCFEEDIKNKRLYVVCEEEELVSSFVLCDTFAGENSIEWSGPTDNVFYIDRLGVGVSHTRKGIGSKTLTFAKEIATNAGATSLRLFVIDINLPAIQLYLKNGFKRATGIYEEHIDEELTFLEYGFEISLP